MKLISTVCAAAFAAASMAAYAQHDPAYLKTLESKSAQMRKCADMARALEKIPVPEKHAEAKELKATAELSKVKSAAPMDPKHASFESKVKQMDAEFAKCGTELFRDMPAVEQKVRPYMDGVKKAKLAEPDMKANSKALGDYMKAKQDLQAAVELLSKDVQMQAYVQKTLQEHYLNQKY